MEVPIENAIYSSYTLIIIISSVHARTCRSECHMACMYAYAIVHVLTATAPRGQLSRSRPFRPSSRTARPIQATSQRRRARPGRPWGRTSANWGSAWSSAGSKARHQAAAAAAVTGLHRHRRPGRRSGRAPPPCAPLPFRGRPTSAAASLA